MKSTILREIGIVTLENVTLPYHLTNISSFKDSFIVKSFEVNQSTSEWSFFVALVWSLSVCSCVVWMVYSNHHSLKDSERQNNRKKRRQMSLIGKFSLTSQTTENPSIITFFAKLRGKHFSMNEFDELWRHRVMNKHERFNCHVSLTHPGNFEVEKKSMDVYASEVVTSDDFDLSKRIEEMLTSTLNVHEKLWEVELLPSSKDEETIVLFRVHHCLCDGVSLSVALGDVSDESSKIQSRIQQEILQVKKKLSQQQFYFFKVILCYYLMGSIIALSLQFWRLLTSINPFANLTKQSGTGGRRTVAWKYLAPMDEIKKVIKCIDPSITVNDLGVFLTCAAVSRRIAQLDTTIPPSVNITIPVHTRGGVLLPGQSLGNHIGAFVTSVPCKKVPTNNNHKDELVKRLKATSNRCKEGKYTPAPFIAHSMCKFISQYFPSSIAKWTLRNGNANSVAIVSNIRGFPFPVHWFGRHVEYMNAFLPIPPGIPIGVCLQSYASEVSFTVTADQHIVPNATEFASWMKQEYQQLKEQTINLKQD